MSAAPLLVVALGGNAISPPTGGITYAGERTAVAMACRELAALADGGARLLVVHGNGPQVGRLLSADTAATDLDIRVAQTQGELGYLLAASLADAGAGDAAALVCRTEVDRADPAFGVPDKPVGPLFMERPQGASGSWQQAAGGWRRVVASPRPRRVPELPLIRALLEHGHVIAGGGGGVPVDRGGRPCEAVVDKDRVAALLARSLHADGLVFATDVDGAYLDYDGPASSLLSDLTPERARALLEAGCFGAGSMAPKVESAVDFAMGRGRPAIIAGLGRLAAAMDGRGGTRVLPGSV